MPQTSSNAPDKCLSMESNCFGKSKKEKTKRSDQSQIGPASAVEKESIPNICREFPVIYPAPSGSNLQFTAHKNERIRYLDLKKMSFFLSLYLMSLLTKLGSRLTGGLQSSWLRPGKLVVAVVIRLCESLTWAFSNRAASCVVAWGAVPSVPRGGRGQIFLKQS